jgi:hypothetical protein
MIHLNRFEHAHLLVGGSLKKTGIINFLLSVVGKLFIVMIGIIILPFVTQANNIQVSNVTLTGQNTTEGYWLVQFDLEWENCWRTDNLFPDDDHIVGNWDSAWVFVKYRVGYGEWQHAKLHSSGHSTGNGTSASLDIGVSNEREAFHTMNNPGVGVFIYRSENGNGTFTTIGNQLRWNYGMDGVPNDAELNIRVFAIEMVYVAPGPFYLGSGGIEFGRLIEGNTSNSPFLATDSWNGCIANTAECLWGTSTTGNSTIGGTGNLHEHYPTGVAGFYSMKYGISQLQYVDFLNTLTPVQASARAYTSGESRNFISFTGGQYVTDNHNVANNFISWMDGAAYLDWSGLRPMTELEYEKAARGPATPVANEYAWGTADIASSSYTLSNAGEADETIATNYSETAGNSMYGGTQGSIGGPVRVGIFATVSSNRVRSGSSYWGIMELSGNLWEATVTVGNNTGRDYTGLHGNGQLTSTGDGTVEAWPGLIDGKITGATGSGFSGGTWESNAADLRVSHRGNAANTITFRHSHLGYRGVRSLPTVFD